MMRTGLYTEFVEELPSNAVTRSTLAAGETRLVLLDRLGRPPVLAVQYRSEQSAESKHAASTIAEMLQRSAYPGGFVARQYLQRENKKLLLNRSQSEFVFENDQLIGFSVSELPHWYSLTWDKKDRLLARVLKRLQQAAEADALLITAESVIPETAATNLETVQRESGVIVTLLDARDLTIAQEELFVEGSEWCRQQLWRLSPVIEQMKEGPMGEGVATPYYALGKPTLVEGTVRYWLNGRSVCFANGISYSPLGWYTLQELLDEKYMEDAARNADKVFQYYDDSDGSYPVPLSSEQVAAKLKAHGLRPALATYLEEKALRTQEGSS